MSELKDIVWNHSADAILELIRSDTIPCVNEEYITTVFGLEKNGIRERAWKRFVSGSLDMNTLKMATSMKSEVYDVCIVFTADGIYMPNKSKCGCPNGWLFCSHTLALFILIRLIQMKNSWTYHNLCTVMPLPIKSLQNLPIPAVMVFKSRTRKTTKAIGRQIAKEVPGYSAVDDNCKDTDEKDEMTALQNDLEEGKEVKSINLCKLLGDHLDDSKDVMQIDGGDEAGVDTKVTAKITSDDIHKFNQDIVHPSPTTSRRCEKLLRHNRIQQMMNDGIISNNNALSYHLHHFEGDRKQQLAEIANSRNEVSLADHYDKEFMDGYFK